ALALSICVLVDDSVVVLENIFRHLHMGKDSWTAAVDGRSEIGVAALAITLVDVVVYTPLGFLTGIVGQFFREFGFSVVAAVLFSLLVSFTLTPMLASRWLRASGRGPGAGDQGSGDRRSADGPTPAPVAQAGGLGRLAAAWDAGFARLEQRYKELLGWSLDHRKTVILVSLLSFVIAIGYFPLHLLGTEFVPNSDQGVFTIQAKMPPGTALPVTDAAARQLEAKLRTVPEIAHMLTSVGTGNDSGFQQETGPRFLQMTILLKSRSQRSRSVDQVLPDVNRMLRTIPGLTGRTQLPSVSGSAQPFVVQIRGVDAAKVAAYGQEIFRLVQHTTGAAEVTNSNQTGAPELDVVANHAKLADLGLTASRVAGVLRTGLTGEVVTHLRPPGQPRVDVRLISRDGSATSMRDLAALPIISDRGVPIRLDQVATIEQVDAVPQIDRRDRERVVSIGASLDGSRALGEVSAAVQSGIQALHLPPGYTVSFAGDTQLQSDSFNSFGIALGLGFILMYMLMAALFESLLYPLAVMFSVPVALFGAFTALVLFRENLGLFSLIGMIMLMGLVAKNAILVIDFAEKTRAQGMSRREALLHAGPIRLRPILMTSATLVVSMIPLAFKLTIGAESRASIGAVVMGGMISSTLLSLVLVPVVYSSLDDLKQRLSGLGGGSRRVQPQPEPAAPDLLPEPVLVSRSSS
ncbi:MAG: efflux RND transporter permease subunit, partial [Chloroflexota bacterium]